MFFLLILVAIIFFAVLNNKISTERKQLINEIFSYLNLVDKNILWIELDDRAEKWDDRVVVKSRQALNNYDELKYLKDSIHLENVKRILEKRKEFKSKLVDFVRGNDFKTRSQYSYVEGKLRQCISMATDFRILVEYITPAGNSRGIRMIRISYSRIKEINEHPEILMTKAEYNKFIKQKTKDELDAKKHNFYDKVNSIIDSVNASKEVLIVKKEERKLDDLVQSLFDRTINSIQKVKQIDSDEWKMLDKVISTTDEQVKKIIDNNKKLIEYYKSDEFLQIKETCKLLTQSRKEFNEYIEEKSQSISKLFGTRVVRNETQNEDSNNYIRAYKKSITPFTAQVSSAVFASAENNPIAYIVKYFYPNKNKYKEQIQKLRILIEELETLKEAKVIIDNYKKDYEQYIKNVPEYVLKNDEVGFYSRLGLTIIDEAILNVEYKFTYTSGGGMAQRSFTVSMNEENIIELIDCLENKLSKEALVKEQRAMMTTKLRNYIKERDNFTCCNCGNSIHNEPNLLLEIDHIIPIARGGLTKEDNLQTLCWKCNRSKGSKLTMTI